MSVMVVPLCSLIFNLSQRSHLNTRSDEISTLRISQNGNSVTTYEPFETLKSHINHNIAGKLHSVSQGTALLKFTQKLKSVNEPHKMNAVTLATCNKLWHNNDPYNSIYSV